MKNIAYLEYSTFHGSLHIITYVDDKVNRYGHTVGLGIKKDTFVTVFQKKFGDFLFEHNLVELENARLHKGYRFFVKDDTIVDDFGIVKDNNVEIFKGPIVSIVDGIFYFFLSQTGLFEEIKVFNSNEFVIFKDYTNDNLNLIENI